MTSSDTGRPGDGRTARAIRRAAWGALALLAAAALAGIPLVDGDGVPYLWDLDEVGAPNVVNGEVTFFLDPRGPRTFDPGSKSHLQARRDAIAKWEFETTAIRFREDTSRTAAGNVSSDRVNYVGFGTGGLGPFTLGATFPTRIGSKIVDMDVVLNSSDFSWSTKTPGQPGLADVEAISAHEWGHAVGCDHIPLRDATMYFATDRGAISYRSLSDDDRALVGGLYPNGAFRQTTGTLRGRVTRVGATDHRAIHVVAISVATHGTVASTFTDASGNWVLQGLPQGAYRLLAAPAIPLGTSVNSYWRSGRRDFVAAWLREGGGNPGRLVTLQVSPGGETWVPAFTVATENNPLEPDGVLGSGTVLTPGDGVCARLETDDDVDFFSFQGQAGQMITLAVHADRLGAELNPQITVLRQGGQVLAQSDDIRLESLHQFSLEGPDLDCRIENLLLPATETYHVRVDPVTGDAGTDSFYALSLTAASNAPSAALTSVSASPDRVDAGSAQQAVLTVRPRRETGADVAPGAEVSLVGSAMGVVVPVVEVGDGTYTASVTAAATPGSESFTVGVTTAAGTVSLPDAVVVVYLGPVSGATTTFTAASRRIDADGAASTRVVLVPRDARGERLGAGRAVSLQLIDAAGASLGAVTGDPDGAYSATLTAGNATGTVRIGATVQGTDAGTTLDVGLGFPLDAVIQQATTDAAAAQLIDGHSKSVRRALSGTAKQLGRVGGLLPVTGGSSAEKKALSAMRKASVKFGKAIRKGAGTVPDLGSPGELARAVRDAARAALARAVIVSGKDQNRADKARDLLDVGQSAYDAGDVDSASRRWLTAYGKVFGLQP